MAQPVSDDRANWKQIVARYAQPDERRSLIQLANSVIPYLVIWILMYFSLQVSYWLTLALAVLAAGFMVRIFIIFHDCGHGSFFKSRKANDMVGVVTGIMTFTPYYRWRHAHAVHHSSAGDLDRRGMGDIWTMTVKEYQDAPWYQRLAYRAYRNPIMILVVGPILSFLVFERFWFGVKGKRERRSIQYTDLALLAILVVAHFTIGLKAYILVQLPIVILGTSAGVWLFYVQHQFEGVYWERHEDWDYVKAAMDGSSYYQLPKILQWFTGNIGFHHIHHLSPRIPNYKLEACHVENPMFQIEPITLRSSLKSLKFRLWDEDNHQLVGFAYLRTLRDQQVLAAEA
jgi:omega-6 fatty acid desaturase (delta-12 desaturase)